MKYLKAIRNVVLPLLVFLCSVSVHGETLSVSEHKQQLHDLAGKIASLKENPEAGSKILAELPKSVSVKVGESEYSVSYETLSNGIGAFVAASPEKRPALLLGLEQYVKTLATQAEAFSSETTDLSSEREKLNAILARREFAKVGGPNAFDRLVGKVYHWLGRILSAIFFPRRSIGGIRQVLVYVLVCGLFLALAVWVVRWLAQPVRAEQQREIVPFSPSAKGWRKWLAEARDLAQQQDWRNAIHLAYWAGISFLEEHGAWKPDRARTPREYLRLLNARNAQHPALTALTRKFEITWYGHRDAAESDFQETLGQLEKLGCR